MPVTDARAALTSDRGAAPTDTAAAVTRAGKPPLPALTAARAFTAVNILLFHFSNPKMFGPLAPVVDGGYASVSFFFLLSGFIIAYNYADRAAAGTLRKRAFYVARFGRLYPVFFISLVISGQMLLEEWHAHSHAMFAAGLVLTPLMLQAWHPELATFWSTPAWALSVEIFLYAVFPWLIQARLPARPRRVVAWLCVTWLLGLVVPVLYCLVHPDGLPAPDRFSGGWWLRALKFFPPVHLPTFFCGILLARLHAVWHPPARTRVALAFAGAAGAYLLLLFCYVTGQRYWTYPLMHDPLLVPLYGMIVFGLSGTHWISRLMAHPVLLAVGEASYCLYILHFNFWRILHEDGLLNALHAQRFDPWISYLLILAVSVAIFRWIEVPARGWIRRLAA